MCNSFSLCGFPHLILATTLGGSYYYHPHFTDEAGEAQEDFSHTERWTRQGIASLSHRQENQGPRRVRGCPRHWQVSRGVIWAPGIAPAASFFLSLGTLGQLRPFRLQRQMTTAVLMGPHLDHGTPSVSPTAFPQHPRQPGLGNCLQPQDAQALL